MRMYRVCITTSRAPPYKHARGPAAGAVIGKKIAIDAKPARSYTVLYHTHTLTHTNIYIIYTHTSSNNMVADKMDASSLARKFLRETSLTLYGPRQTILHRQFSLKICKKFNSAVISIFVGKQCAPTKLRENFHWRRKAWYLLAMNEFSN